MYQPVTVVKVRKETKITVPAGGWVLLGHPDMPLHEQINQRAKLVQDGNVSDDYETLVIGRITDTHTPTRFVTKKEHEAAKNRTKETEKNLADSHISALERQKKHDEAVKAEKQAKHDAEVARLNEEHQDIRTQGQSRRERQQRAEEQLQLQRQAELEAGLKAKADATKALEENLSALNHGELLALANELVTAGTLAELPEKTTKGSLIEAIIASGYTPPQQTE